MSYEEQLKVLKDKLQKATKEKITAEANLANLNTRKEELIAEIKSQGIDPDNLENEINKLRCELDELFDKAKELLPED